MVRTATYHAKDDIRLCAIITTEIGVDGSVFYSAPSYGERCIHDPIWPVTAGRACLEIALGAS